MSFSTLRELEACPRRWALTTAEYLNVWKYRGYPSVPQQSAIEGIVVHLSLQKIMGALVNRGCPSLIDESAILTLRELGGYTAIILSSTEQVLLPYKENPRAVPTLDEIHNRLTASVPKLRTRVQRFLPRIHLVPRPAKSGETVIRREGAKRHALEHGPHAEVLIQSSKLRWRGFADMLTLSANKCEIRDFKTGAPKEWHKVQLLTYALLWARDSDLNPSARLADKLVLSYDERDVELPPPDTRKLQLLEDELKQRTTIALADLQSNNPQAQTSPENCVYCTVRHLCEEYWSWLGKQGSSGEPVKERYVDVQIKLSSQHGPSSWDGIIELGPTMKTGIPILLRTENHRYDLHPGNRLRVLNVYVSIPDEEESVKDGHSLVVVTTGSRSEIFDF
jgi:hypothetical protein